jgi:hypothetical protein
VFTSDAVSAHAATTVTGVGQVGGLLVADPGNTRALKTTATSGARVAVEGTIRRSAADKQMTLVPDPSILATLAMRQRSVVLLLAKRIVTILPPLSFEEALECTKVHSLSGQHPMRGYPADAPRSTPSEVSLNRVVETGGDPLRQPEAPRTRRMSQGMARIRREQS